MKKTGIFIMCALLLIPISGVCFNKVGSTAAPFLKIEFGARAVAMGGSFIALANDPSGVFFNPAGIAEIRTPNVSGGHTVWFADLTYDYAVFVLPTAKINFGLWGSFLSSDDIEITTIESPEGTGQYCKYIDGLLGFTVSTFLSDRLSIGFSGKYIQQSLYNETAYTLAMDIGTILRTPLKGARLGMCLVNYGGRLQLSGNDLIIQTDPWPNYSGNPDVEARLNTESFPLPLAFKLGIALDILGSDAIFLSHDHCLTIAVDGIHPNDGEEKVHLGCEYGLFNTLFLRSGYKMNYDTQKYTAGAGIVVSIGKRQVCVDYAYVDMDMLDATHRVSLAIGF